MPEPRLRILLVDDDEDTFVLTRGLLSQPGMPPCQLDWAGSYEQGLQRIGEAAHDAYLIDYRMGHHDGLELLKEARAAGCRAPLILLTGQEDRSVDLEAMQAGAADYLIKGRIDASVLERSIRYALERSRREIAETSLRDSEALYQSLVESLPVCVLRKDLQGRFTFANRAYAEFTGRNVAEILGQTDYDVSPAEVAEKFQQDDEEVVRTGRQMRAIEVNQSNGRRHWVEVIKTPVHDSQGRTIGTQAIFWDVTERQQAVEALQQAKEAAEAADRAKSEFLANMSHEIRTPMNGIIGMAELLAGTTLRSDQQEFLQIIQQSADSLLRLLNDILDFSKIEAGRLELESIEFGLQDCIGKAVHLLSLRAAEKGLELACRIAPDAPPRLVGDSGRLRQIIVNLVGNSIKFTEQGEIVVNVEAEGAADGRVILHVAVRDTGVGIPEPMRPKLFQAFSQGDASTTRKYGGTGLGLAISARLVEMMGGRIWFENAAGGGTTFHFTAEFGAAAGRARVAELPELRGLPILIVDDNATNRRILQEMTANWRMRPFVAASAAAGLDMVRDAERRGEPIQLILLDYRMPNIDGLEFAQRLASLPDWTACPIIMLTSSVSGLNTDQLRKRGIVRCMTKPVIASELLQAIRETRGDEPLRGAGESSSDRPPLAPRRILLVEDNLVNQKVALGFLEKWGQRVVVATDGRQAVDVASREPFDLILMDVQMPVMNGFEATAHLREAERQGRWRSVPIIAMTAEAMKGDREKCLAAGMDDYLGKPIDPDALYAIVARTTSPEDGRGYAAVASSRKPSGAAEPSAAAPPREQRPNEPEQAAAPRDDGLVDWSHARRQTGNDEQLLREVIDAFRYEAPKLLAAIADSLRIADAPLLRRSAHTLKSAASYFGARRVVEMARALESAGRDRSLDAAREIHAQLEQETRALLESLRHGPGR